jgi:sulfur carrier protein
MIQIQLNGAAYETPEATTLSALLAQLGLADKRVALERNGAIVPKSAHASTELSAGDQIEIVQAIGGG